MIIPVINVIFTEDYTGNEKNCTIIELSRDVIREIAQKYENVQKGIDKTKKETALRMLQDGELPIEKVAKYSGRDISEIELLAGIPTG